MNGKSEQQTSNYFPREEVTLQIAKLAFSNEDQVRASWFFLIQSFNATFAMLIFQFAMFFL
jgi:hypothetical protein